ncbi:MAG: FtsQ-type POTRA domain-containing protein [Acidobacteria bacterium]|nr:FtsQ-type POTRA domain-containing protein [Acidobacteriota bacterium]
MAKTTRTNPASRGSLTLIEDEALDESYEPAPPRRGARDSAGDARPAEDASPRLRPFRPVETETEDEPFLRVRRRVPVRRGVLPAWSRTRWGRILFIALVLSIFAAGITLSLAVRSFFLHDQQFRIGSTAAIQTVGNTEVTRDAILSVFGSDVGRNIFYVPLAKRRAELERMPWVQSASVMRILPDQLRVSIVERKPVAFLQTGSQISLIDAQGMVLGLTPGIMARHHFSFPVITGLDPNMPEPTRAARVQLYLKFLQTLDSGGNHISSQISEVDLADPEDVRATITTGHRDLLLHFGREDFLARYQRYKANIQNWLTQYPALSAVDLRYKDQVVLTMAHPAAPPDAAKTNSAIPAKRGRR